MATEIVPTKSDANLSLDPQMLDEAILQMQMKRKYSSDLRDRFRSVPLRKEIGSSFKTVVVPMDMLSPPSVT